MLNNIKKIAEQCCTGCGTCSNFCPEGAIKILFNDKLGIFKPVIDESLCVDCGFCLRICPVSTWSNEKKTDSWLSYVGDYHSVYAAYSKDQNLRLSCSSGGVVTAILLALLRENEITGAVVIRRCVDNPLMSEAFIARTADEIISAKGSKYSPVSYDQIYTKLGSLDTNTERLAFVGLPCHIEGLNSVSKYKKKIRDIIKYKISLVCGGFPSLNAYEYIFKKLRVNKKEISSISNRGNGWPGYMTIEEKDGNIRKLPYGHKLSMGTVLSSPFFRPWGCLMCKDPCGFNADMCISDAWLPRFKNNSEGVNLVLCKNNICDNVLKKLTSNDLNLMDANINDFINANKGVFLHKINSVYLGRFFFRDSKNYSTKMVSETRLKLLKKVKVFIYFLSLKIMSVLGVKNKPLFANRFILFYCKFLNLLKS